MLNSFQNRNVGPMADGELTFARQLNVFTGDNSLGKSFLLDLLWYGLTRHWPHDLNPLLDGGYPARPSLIKEKAELVHNVVELFDEIEAHLHPRWQHSIVKGLRTAIPLVFEAAGLLKEELQLFLSTHSPLVMAALEDEFASSAPPKATSGSTST